jgi:hypothetical protein
MGYAARVMLGLIIDHARSRNAIKRGGNSKLPPSKPTQARIRSTPKNSRPSAMHWINWRKLSLSWLRLIDLKFFCGLSFAEIAALENLSERTIQRKWEKARIYLHRNIRGDLPV